MADALSFGKIIRIRDCGYDEIWLQDQIVANPSCLGLGDLEVLTRERRQSSGGRLDILLKDPEDDSMYEVVAQPPRGKGARLTIRYQLPRAK